MLENYRKDDLLFHRLEAVDLFEIYWVLERNDFVLVSFHCFDREFLKDLFFGKKFILKNRHSSSCTKLESFSEGELFRIYNEYLELKDYRDFIPDSILLKLKKLPILFFFKVSWKAFGKFINRILWVTNHNHDSKEKWRLVFVGRNYTI